MENLVGNVRERGEAKHRLEGRAKAEVCSAGPEVTECADTGAILTGAGLGASLPGPPSAEHLDLVGREDMWLGTLVVRRSVQVGSGDRLRRQKLSHVMFV